MARNTKEWDRNSLVRAEVAGRIIHYLQVEEGKTYHYGDLTRLSHNLEQIVYDSMGRYFDDLAEHLSGKLIQDGIAFPGTQIWLAAVLRRHMGK